MLNLSSRILGYFLNSYYLKGYSNELRMMMLKSSFQSWLFYQKTVFQLLSLVEQLGT